MRLEEFVPPEDRLQVSVADALAKLLRPPAQFAAYPAGHIRLTGQQASKLYRAGLRAAWPDLLVLFPGKLIGIELKTLDGVLSRSRWVRTKRGKPRWVEGQREMFPKLKAAGMRGPYLCRSVEQVLHVLEAEGCPLLKWQVAA